MFFYDQQLKSISFYPKIIKNYRKLDKNFDDHVLVTKIRYAFKNYKESIAIFCNAHKGNSLPGEHCKIGF